MSSYSELEAALSLERFGRYLAWAGGDRARAIELYTLNTRVSESLYTPLQTLEVALRNRIHSVMSEAVNEEWFRASGMLLGEWQPQQLAKAIEDIRREGREPTAGRIVAAVTFGFWTAMFGKHYENLWQTTLHSIGSRENGKGLARKDFSRPLLKIRYLRNRVAHHEPVIGQDLQKIFAQMMELTSWLSPPAAEWCASHCRFTEVYPSPGVELHA